MIKDKFGLEYCGFSIEFVGGKRILFLNDMPSKGQNFKGK